MHQSDSGPQTPELSAPIAPKIPKIRVHHQDEFVDNYEWMRDKDSATLLEHLQAENAYTAARTKTLAPLEEDIFNEIKNRTQESDISVPVRKGNWWLYSRTEEGQQYSLQCRLPAASADDWDPPQIDSGSAPTGEEILLDGNKLAEGEEFFALGSFDLSDDGTLLLYGIDTTGDERYTLKVRELHSGKDLDLEIPNTSAGATFSPDASHIIYTTVDEAWRPDTVWAKTVATTDAAKKLFQEKDESFWVGAGFSRNRRFLIIESSSSVTSEQYLVPSHDLSQEPRVIWKKQEGVEYDANCAIVDGKDVLYIVHNRDSADFTVSRVNAAAPSSAAETVIAHQPGRRIESFNTFRDWASVEYRSGGLTRIGMFDYHNNSLEEIPFSEELYSAALAGNPEWAPPLIRLGYTSFITPTTVYDYDYATQKLLLRKQQAVLGDFSSANYAQKRLWVTARDGTEIPVSLVWKKSFAEPGLSPRALHLYGYGSYEASIDPGFSIPRLSELDRGMIFAIAHVRGGGEMGRHWYETGKKLHKKNSFTDFVDVAKHLTETGYTTAAQLVAEGGSAGGLLMGAVTNLAPEAFAGVLAEVPFVDALTTILDPSLPLTVIEWDEWGNPLADPEVYEYMKSYSPYENVKERVKYPKILAVTSLNDTRVFYVEPAKWVARLREVGADALLKCEMVAGHGGVSGRYNSWRERAFELAWLIHTAGL